MLDQDTCRARMCVPAVPAVPVEQGWLLRLEINRLSDTLSTLVVFPEDPPLTLEKNMAKFQKSLPRLLFLKQPYDWSKSMDFECSRLI